MNEGHAVVAGKMGKIIHVNDIALNDIWAKTN
jgi:hypothetical protein